VMGCSEELGPRSNLCLRVAARLGLLPVQR
jgi:hypothetical protein